MPAEYLDMVVEPDPGETIALKELQNRVDSIFRDGYTPCLIGPTGDQIELPGPAFELLRTLLRGMAEGRSMTLMPSERLLTTQQAADQLQVSRPHLVKLLNDGAIPFERVGTHRRIRVSDLSEYRQSRSSVRREALRELSKIAADSPGGYR